ncbi:DUF1015 family protein [Aquipuribacter hungaricus]|uniref:DUF1015 family protein n=1 Tax=Aquipuribacter hungaricus TaxID=545624 RepID=A0ABV7WC12_9MICO
MITGTAGVSPVRLLHPDPETARQDSRLTELGWVPSGRDLLAPPAVYAVELDSPVARVRGVVAAWEVLDPPAGGGLVPHEQTDARAVRRRVRALRTAHLDRDPLLLTHRGGGAVRRAVDATATPVYEVTDRQRHVRVLQLPDDAGQEVLGLLTGEDYLVADGHHRLAAAAQLRAEGVASQVTALVVDADDTPLVLGPIHRVLLDEQGRDRVDEAMVASVLDRCSGAGALVVEHDDAEAGDASVVLVHGARRWTVTWPERPRTDVTTLVEHVLDDTARSRTRREPDTRVATAAAEHGALTCLLPPPDLDEVLALARRGALLPYKATAFEPKLPPGSLVRPLPAWTPRS